MISNWNEFGRYVNEKRAECGASMEQLGFGLCTPGMVKRIEEGERYPDRLLRDRLLERMGIASYDYNNYLNADEYAEWEKRQKILRLIDKGNLKMAEEALAGLLQDKDIDNPVKKQFYLFCLAQLMKRQGDEGSLESIYDEALRLTVPKIDSHEISRLLVSVSELMLILEYEHYGQRAERMDIYKQLLEYVERPYFDMPSKAEAYPKIAYYIGRELIGAGLNKESCMYIIKICNRAIDILGISKRGYYLWELLDIRDKVYEFLLSDKGFTASPKRSDTIQGMKEENKSLTEAIEFAYELAGLDKRMLDDTYLYKEYAVYCIADVIRKRRKNLGMTVKQLAEGFIGEKTLIKIEKRQANPHMTTVKELFRRLNMSSEQSQQTVVSSNPEVKDVLRELRKISNASEYEKSEELVFRLKNLLSMDNPVNKQFIVRSEIVNEWKLHRISNDEFIKGVREALEYTIPYENAIKKGEKYLTDEEILCVYTMAMAKNDEEKRECIDFIDDICTEYEELGLEGAYDSTYKVLMTNAASWRGNLGEYSISTDMSMKVIRLCMQERHLAFLNGSVYDIAWNMKTEANLGKVDGSIKRYVVCAYEIAKLFKAQKKMSFYLERIRNW